MYCSRGNRRRPMALSEASRRPHATQRALTAGPMARLSLGANCNRRRRGRWAPHGRLGATRHRATRHPATGRTSPRTPPPELAAQEGSVSRAAPTRPAAGSESVARAPRDHGQQRQGRPLPLPVLVTAERPVDGQRRRHCSTAALCCSSQKRRGATWWAQRRRQRTASPLARATPLSALPCPVRTALRRTSPR